MKAETRPGKEDLVFYDCREKPFAIYGVIPPIGEEGVFVRIPQTLAEQINDGVAFHNQETAGGRVRFTTNSAYMAIYAELGVVGKNAGFAFSGSIGMDLYEWRDGVQTFMHSLIPPFDVKDSFECTVELGEEKKRDLIINLPLLSGIQKLYIGLSRNAKIEKSPEYRYPIPVVYYGSSITQGGCASRPGNAYQSMISQKLDCNFINLGFSGSARGESLIGDYISRLPMSAFVYDYDHNAPSAEHLRATHQAMFEQIRKANPNLAIILCTRPETNRFEDTEERVQVIRKTYYDAAEKGDRNVFMIDGRDMVARFANSWSMDGVHPNDLGFYAMADSIGTILKMILQENAEQS